MPPVNHASQLRSKKDIAALSNLRFGPVAVALAVLGAKVHVIDFSEENRSYVTELANAPIWVESDVPNPDSNGASPENVIIAFGQ